VFRRNAIPDDLVEKNIFSPRKEYRVDKKRKILIHEIVLMIIASCCSGAGKIPIENIKLG